METRLNNNADARLEVVLYEGEVAKTTHRKLFSLDERSYVAAGEEITGSILSVTQASVTRVHISAGWEAILKVALWTAGKLPLHDVLALLKNAGATDEELAPFRKAEITDLFYWLYYGKRFNILRRICNAAKAKAESRIERKKVIVYCHLVSGEAGAIVASSL